MKLRTTTGSIRLRVMRSELAQLGSEQTLAERVAFPGGASLAFSLSVAPQEADVSAAFHEDTVTVTIARTVYDRWTLESEVGVYAMLPVEGHQALEVSIEKDFACLDRSDADNSDTFENPHAGRVC